MDLFVVNRHLGDDQNEITEADEKSKLDKVLQRIEKNKRIRNRQKERENKIKLAKQRTLESRQIKRELKAKIIPVPENVNDEFIDKTITEELINTEEQIQGTDKTGEIKKPKQSTKNLEGFTILGSENFAKKSKVKRVLPKWLSNPTVISLNLQNLHTKVSEVKLLDKGIRKLLKANDINYFFPVQAEVIPWLLETNKHADVMFPRDICVSAPTGSGKTLAFVLPVIQALKQHSVRKIRALVILPTQDLANQVFKTFKTYSQNTNINICLITGQNQFAIEQSQLVSEKPTSQTGKILNLYSLQKRRPPQKLLFSATLSQDPEKLQKLSLFQPKLFTSVNEDSDAKIGREQFNTETFIGKYTTPKELTEKYIVTPNELKVEEISSNLQGKNRTLLIDKFTNGEVDLLVCTDAMARGMDLPNVQCVVSYSAPKYLKTYIHRSGRTARAGENGLSITLVHKSQLSKFQSMLEQAGKKNIQELTIDEEDLEPLGEQYKKSLQELKKIVEKEEKLNLEKNISAKRSKNLKRKRKNSIDSVVSHSSK
ncbi:hypothetical protein NQ314_018405 [Rhamnusium bicolor]|uniref:Uncharacterized protein n=1 Tax=Rhamnusium bicolor TaxID=1586634 RepID=A0AAV8WRG5_9CUCU|nr:hypothetical protein NQ314_018405 [Rhamnusium bicolor]